MKEPLLYLKINVDYNRSHINIKNSSVCNKKCKDKPCTYICPSFVYEWTGKNTEVFYERCIECGACILACPNNNIHLGYPAGGYGVVWEY